MVFKHLVSIGFMHLVSMGFKYLVNMVFNHFVSMVFKHHVSMVFKHLVSMGFKHHVSMVFKLRNQPLVLLINWLDICILFVFPEYSVSTFIELKNSFDGVDRGILLAERI